MKNSKIKTKIWNDIAINDEFMDGSKVLSIHEKYEAECYRVFYKSGIRAESSMILSDEHLLLCDISNLSKESKQWVIDNFANWKIPTLYNKHVYCKDLSKLQGKMTYQQINEILGEPVEEKCEVVEADPSQVSENEFWLPVKTIFLLVRQMGEKILCNGKSLNVEYSGVKKVFCVETDSHRFETGGLVHHNSVTLRDIIFHCLTHGDQISIALVDLKYTEFSYFKGTKNVVAVANTVQEACEILRLAREVMYKRNQELAKIGITDIKDFKPQKPTGEVMVAGRRLKDIDTVQIKTVNGEEKTVTVKELEQYL